MLIIIKRIDENTPINNNSYIDRKVIFEPVSFEFVVFLSAGISSINAEELIQKGDEGIYNE